MKILEAKSEIRRYLSEISKPNIILSENKETLLSEVAEMLSKKSLQKKDVYAYMDFILETISDLNEFYKNKGDKTRIPFSRILNFARQKARFSEFLFNKKAGEKVRKDGDLGMAGVNSFDEDDSSAETIVFGNLFYEFLISIGGIDFFFNPIKGLLVRKRSKVFLYSQYRKKQKKKNKKYIRKTQILKEIKKKDINTEAAISYKIHIRVLKSKIIRKKARSLVTVGQQPTILKR